MILQKINHHLSFIFLAFVLLAQGLLFVVTRAVPIQAYPLQVEWVSPKNGQTFVAGQEINLAAKITSKDQKIGPVFFVISDENVNFVIHFETKQGMDGLYRNVSKGSTDGWESGVYSITPHAKLLDAQGKLTTKSIEGRPLLVRILSLEDYNKLSGNIDNNVSQSSITPPGDQLAQADDRDVLPPGTHNTVNTSTPTSTNATTSSSTNNTTSTPANLPPDLELVVPQNNSTINQRQFLVRFLTNFSAGTAKVEFINVDNAAISTGAMTIDPSDGYNWVKNLELSDIFVNGSYKLLVTVSVPNNTQLLTKSFDYELNVPEEIKLEDLFMTLLNLPSNVQGEVALRADANLPISNLDFVIEDSVNHQEFLRIKGINISTTESSGPTFLATWDTAVLANGNYFVFVESKVGQQKVGSTRQLVTVYNPNNDDLATSTPINFDNESPTTTPPLNISTSTQPTVNAVTPTVTSGIDCERSGITDQSLCQKYQAELNDNLPDICQQNNIFNGDDCEKYIAQNSTFCSDKKITDAKKCQDYLLKNFAANLYCGINATSTCQSVQATKYISRLAYLSEQRNKLNLLIDPLIAKGTTLNSFTDQLASTTSSTLSLAASDKNIQVYKLKNSSLVDSSENLLTAAPAFMMIDSDNDILPDDLEEYYQTDPLKADSDGDGFLDGEEVRNNFNPLGEGKLEKERTPLDQSILAKVPLEEPKISKLLAADAWSISQASSGSSGLSLVGKALPNTWVNIFIYSDIPYVATTKSDLNGGWSYILEDHLTEGVHQVYVASNDKSGKLLAQSAPLTFLVANISNEAESNDNLNQQVNVISDTAKTTSSWTIYYIIGGVLLFIVLLGVVLWLIKKRKQKPDSLVQQGLAQATPEATSVAPQNIVAAEPIVAPRTTEIHLPETPPSSNAENK